MKYYNFDTMYKYFRDLLREFLIDNNIYFEISGGAALYHFEIFTDSIGAQMINNFLDNNTI